MVPVQRPLGGIVVEVGHTMTSQTAQRGHEPQAAGQPAIPTGLTAQDIRQAVHDALDDVFRETVAPLMSLLLDGGNPEWKAERVEHWMERRQEGEARVPAQGDWMRTADGPWHVSTGMAEMPLHGRVLGWYSVLPMCGRRYRLTGDLWSLGTIPGGRRVESRHSRPADGLCHRCVAKASAKGIAA